MAPEGYSSRERHDSPTAVHERRTAGASSGKDRNTPRTGFLDMMGLAAVILAIVGLAGVAPPALSALSIVCLGVSLTTSGASLARDSHLISGGLSRPSRKWFAVETIAGTLGALLGVLVFFPLATTEFIPVASTALGAALVAGGVGSIALATEIGSANSARTIVTDKEVGQDLARAAALEVIVGLSAIILGIIALFYIVPTVLALVATLIMGVAVMIAGGLVGVRISKVMEPS